MAVGGTSMAGGADDGLAYRVIGLVGRGPTSDVYRAEHPMHANPVALKVSRRPLTPGDAEAFQQDRLLLRRLADHPHVVGLLDASTTTTGRAWTVTELHDFSLAATRPGGPDWNAGVAQGWSLDVLRGLAAIHAAGGTHRQLKPSNVLVKDGVAALSDLGGGTPVGHIDAAADTQGFVAPELVRGGAPTSRSDVYAAGLTLSWLLGPDAPHAVHQVVAKASSTDPLDRPADGAAFLEALEVAWDVTAQRPLPSTTVDPDTVQLTLRSAAASRPAVPLQRDRRGPWRPRIGSLRRIGSLPRMGALAQMARPSGLGALRRVAPLMAVLLTAAGLAAALQLIGNGSPQASQALPEVTLTLPPRARVDGNGAPVAGQPQPVGPGATVPTNRADAGAPPATNPPAGPTTPPANRPDRPDRPAPPRQPAPQERTVNALPVATAMPVDALPPPDRPAGAVVPFAYLPELPRLSPAAENDIRPRWDTRRVWLVVTNLGQQPVQVFWRDLSGRRVLIATVRPQDTDTIRTWESHTFAIVDAAGRTRFVVIAPGTSGRVTLSA